MQEEEYYTSVAVVIIIMSCLSILGGLIVVLTYMLLKQLRNFALKMVVYLCLSDILSNISMLLIPPNVLHSKIGEYEHSSICTAQSLFQSWGDLSSIIWSGLISVVIFLTVVKRVQVDKLRKKEYIFLIIGFLFPLLVSSIPFINDVYGEDTYYCWVKSSAKNSLICKILINYAPLWLTFLVITILNCFTTQTIKNMENVPVIQQKSMKKMLLYPYILIITSFWASVVAIMEFSNQEIPEFIQILHHLFARSLGILNACIYGLTPVVRSKLRNSLYTSPLSKSEKKNKIIKKNFKDEQIHSEGDDNNSNQGYDDQFNDNFSDSSDDMYSFKNGVAINDGSFNDNNFLKTENTKEKLHEILL